MLNQPKKNFTNLKIIFNITIFLFVLYSFSCVIIIYVAGKENDRTKNILKKQSPDLIAVFTGDYGRIPYALKIAVKYPTTKILITGANPAQTIEKFSRHNKKILDQVKIDIKRIIFDNNASNTFENVIFTLRYLRKNDALKNILIISSDYHILRIKHIIQETKNRQRNLQFWYSGIRSDYKQFRNIKILFNESFKFIKTLAFLLLWETDE